MTVSAPGQVKYSFSFCPRPRSHPTSLASCAFLLNASWAHSLLFLVMPLRVFPRTRCYLDSLRPTLFASFSLASIPYYRPFDPLVLARPRILLLSYSFLSFLFSSSLASVSLIVRILSLFPESSYPLSLSDFSERPPPSYYTLLTSIFPYTGSASYIRLSRSHRLSSAQQGGSKRSRSSAPSIIILSCCIRRVYHLCVRGVEERIGAGLARLQDEGGLPHLAAGSAPGARGEPWKGRVLNGCTQRQPGADGPRSSQQCA